MELEWTPELTDVCAALATQTPDKIAITQAAGRVRVAIGSVNFPDNSQGQWQALLEAAARQDKLFKALKDLRRMFPESSAAIDPALLRHEPRVERVAMACGRLRDALEGLRSADDLDETEVGDMVATVRALFELDDQWQSHLRRPLDGDQEDLRAGRRARKLFRMRLDACLAALHVYRDVLARQETFEPFGASGLQAILNAKAQTKLNLLRAVEDLINVAEDVR